MSDGFQLIPARASTMAYHIDDLVLFLLCVTAFFTILIFSLIIIFVVKYRRKNPNDIGKNIGEHHWLEWTWIIIPSLIEVVMFVWGAALYVRMSRPPANSLEIQVIGKQWMWKIQHPSGRKEIDELHIPVGRPIKLVMTSQDVIHSFFIPEFRVKQDVVPGRYSTEWFTPTKIGQYHLFCSEYCGTGHASMAGRVVVMSPADYAKWEANVPLDQTPEASGAKLFLEYGCMTCHGQQAPSLAGIYGRQQTMSTGEVVTVDDDYLRESILNSRAKIVAGYPPVMPGYQGQLSEEQVMDLISYIKSLQGAATLPAPNLPQNGGSPP
ncbi:MAG TPA: cytochrome c oxidase subunit II [Phycisphaerae bacterium]|nr:cytochrome c oxidase subunit II [Phycisphaerae bacterium]